MNPQSLTTAAAIFILLFHANTAKRVMIEDHQEENMKLDDIKRLNSEICDSNCEEALYRAIRNFNAQKMKDDAYSVPHSSKIENVFGEDDAGEMLATSGSERDYRREPGSSYTQGSYNQGRRRGNRQSYAHSAAGSGFGYGFGQGFASGKGITLGQGIGYGQASGSGVGIGHGRGVYVREGTFEGYGEGMGIGRGIHTPSEDGKGFGQGTGKGRGRDEGLRPSRNDPDRSGSGYGEEFASKSGKDIVIGEAYDNRGSNGPVYGEGISVKSGSARGYGLALANVDGINSAPSHRYSDDKIFNREEVYETGVESGRGDNRRNGMVTRSSRRNYDVPDYEEGVNYSNLGKDTAIRTEYGERRGPQPAYATGISVKEGKARGVGIAYA